MKGRTRCAAHGGKTPKGRHSGNLRHGLYSNALTETEAAAWDTVPLGDVDAEIRMCKVWLARAFELDNAISNAPASLTNKAGMVLSEIRQSSQGEAKATDVITRRPDTALRINMLLGRIASLEKVRAELIAAQAEHGDGDGTPLPWVD
ncbi:hypothetical protein IGS68_35080 (plasmid) [Skermanella sp. TT6]|uniref:Terminase small subunit n=2 Tax=Skermanella cutis TaxID=2775420 RepID=A0ABX7BKH3_9PROT|nr:hypothetical protein IGS68_35080 [Skermanella sp. TT6]